MTPYFHSIADFLAMGKHGFYVWLSFGLTWLCILGIIMYSRSQRQSAYNDILTQQARQTQRQKRPS